MSACPVECTSFNIPQGKSFELKKPNNIGLKCCFWGQFVTKGYDVGSLMSELASYNRRPEDVSEEIALTVRAIVEISGK